MSKYILLIDYCFDNDKHVEQIMKLPLEESIRGQRKYMVMLDEANYRLENKQNE